jgi:hypothetical protein
MKTLRNAGIAIIIGLILGIGSFIYTLVKIIPLVSQGQAAITEAAMNLMPLQFQIISSVIGLVVMLFIYAGFITLGKKFNNQFLVVTSWILLVALIISGGVSTFVLQASSPVAISTLQAVQFISSLAVIILFIFLGVGLIKIRKQLKLAKVTGILYIVGAATSFILIGALIIWIAQAFAAAMFFRASKEFESKKTLNKTKKKKK